MFVFRFAIATILVGTTAPAHAAEWYKLGSAKDGTSVYIADVGSVGETTNAWVKLDYTTKTMTDSDVKNRALEEQLASRGLLACNGMINLFCKPGGDAAAQAIQRWSIHCLSRRIKVVANTVYNASGRVLRSEEDSSSFAVLVIPDSIGEIVVDTACDD